MGEFAMALTAESDRRLREAQKKKAKEQEQAKATEAKEMKQVSHPGRRKPAMKKG